MPRFTRTTPDRVPAGDKKISGPYVERRRALAIPSWKVATLAGISPTQLANFECGRMGLRPDALARVDAILAAFEALEAQATARLAASAVRDMEAGAHHGRR